MNENLPDVSTYENELKKLRKDDIHPTRQTTLVELIEKGHDRHFVGRIGSFCPIKPGCGGGELVRDAKDTNGNVKYDSVTGADGYRWLEAEMVRALGKEADIDRSYYDELVNAAIYGKGSGKDRKPGIADFGDFEQFVSDDPMPTNFPIDDDDLPWYVGDELEAALGDAFKKR